MQQPLDYPLDYPLEDSTDDAGGVTAPAPARGDCDVLTYAALLDRYESEEQITDEMIFQACRNMDAAQQFPFAASGDEESILSFRRWFRVNR